MVKQSFFLMAIRVEMFFLTFFSNFFSRDLWYEAKDKDLLTRSVQGNGVVKFCSTSADYTVRWVNAVISLE